MIVFDLGCANNHRFEGWFDSNEDYERQVASKLVACPLCGSADVTRVPHATHIRTANKDAPARADSSFAAPQQYANVDSDVLAKVIEHIVRNTEDVGSAFPEEARKIHYRETPERKIRGTASREEVDELREEGIDVVALPVSAHRLGKTH